MIELVSKVESLRYYYNSDREIITSWKTYLKSIIKDASKEELYRLVIGLCEKSGIIELIDSRARCVFDILDLFPDDHIILAIFIREATKKDIIEYKINRTKKEFHPHLIMEVYRHEKVTEGSTTDEKAGLIKHILENSNQVLDPTPRIAKNMIKSDITKLLIFLIQHRKVVELQF